MGFPRLMTAMVTPFRDDLEVDYGQARKLAAYLIQNGSQGLVVCGTTGESPTLTMEEKLRLFAEVKAEVGKDVPVWAGIGSNSTKQSAELAQRASELPVDGVMAVTPYYNKPSQEGLYRHFAAIAEAASLPLMLYNVPGRTGVNLLPETVKRLAAMPNIVALKEASGNMDQLSHLKQILAPDFIIYSGDDSLTLPMLSLGAHGVVSVASHLVGKPMLAMIEAFFAGRYAEATQKHLEIFDVCKVLFITSNPIPLKAALKMVGGDSGNMRLPLWEASDKERMEIEDVLKKSGII